MEKRIVNVGKNTYEFMNESWSNSRAWGHRSILFKNGYQIGENRVRYINRTWESYTFQSCMSGLVYSLNELAKEGYINTYKSKNNIARFKKGQKEQVIKEYEETEQAKEYAQIRKALQYSR
jgi:hypothetical protein